jgi:hypothetical protein
MAQEYEESLKRIERLVGALTTLRVWSKRLENGMSVALTETSDAGLQIPELIAVVEHEFEALLIASNRRRKSRLTNSLRRGAPSKYAVIKRNLRWRKRARVYDMVERYLNLYRPDLIEEIKYEITV